MLKEKVRTRREYRVVYYNPSSQCGEYAKIPWYRHAYTIQDARKIKCRLENKGKVNVNILVYDTTMYKIR